MLPLLLGLPAAGVAAGLYKRLSYRRKSAAAETLDSLKGTAVAVGTMVIAVMIVQSVTAAKKK